MITTLTKILSCQELYFYRQATKYLYNFLTNKVIIQKLSGIVDSHIMNVLGDNYEEFINMIIKDQCILFGEWLWKAFYGEECDRIRICTYTTNMASTWEHHLSVINYGYCKIKIYNDVNIYVLAKKKSNIINDILKINANIIKNKSVTYQFHMDGNNHMLGNYIERFYGLPTYVYSVECSYVEYINSAREMPPLEPVSII